MSLSHIQFMIAAGRHRGSHPDDPGLRDPLAAIVEIVTKTPYTPESRLLFQVLGGMRVDNNAYTEATYLFSTNDRLRWSMRSTAMFWQVDTTIPNCMAP